MKEKPKCRMKGQMVFEFVIATVLMFSVVFYVISYSSNSMNTYHSTFLSDSLESKAVSISEFALNHHDYGLMSSWPVLSKEKMNVFNMTCNAPGGYELIMEGFGLIERVPYSRHNHIYINATTPGGKVYVNCGRTPPGSSGTALVTRFGLIEPDEMVKIEITVW